MNYNWTKLEPGCQMPEIDEFVLWRTECGHYFVREIDKDDNDWWNGNPSCKGTSWTPVCTHWKRIEDGDEPDQDILWGEVSIQLQDANLEGKGQRKGVMGWLKNKYTLIRK